MRDMTPQWLAATSVQPDQLLEHGVTHKAAQFVGGVRLARDGRLLLPCWIDPPSVYHFVSDPALLGVVAFNPDTPDNWTVHPEDAGAIMLGEVALREAVWHGEPLPVFGNPLTWLRSGSGGVFPLDWPGFAREMLWHPEVELVTKDVGLGKRIRSELDRAAKVRKPRLSVEIPEAV